MVTTTLSVMVTSCRNLSHAVIGSSSPYWGSSRNGHPIFQVPQKWRNCEGENLRRIKDPVRGGASRMRRNGKIISFGIAKNLSHAQ
jgi:hypothetical protein